MDDYDIYSDLDNLPINIYNQSQQEEQINQNFNELKKRKFEKNQDLLSSFPPNNNKLRKILINKDIKESENQNNINNLKNNQFNSNHNQEQSESYLIEISNLEDKLIELEKKLNYLENDRDKKTLELDKKSKGNTLLLFIYY